MPRRISNPVYALNSMNLSSDQKKKVRYLMKASWKNGRDTGIKVGYGKAFSKRKA